jgi:hypothetical protein
VADQREDVGRALALATKLLGAGADNAFFEAVVVSPATETTMLTTAVIIVRVAVIVVRVAVIVAVVLDHSVAIVVGIVVGHP